MPRTWREAFRKLGVELTFQPAAVRCGGFAEGDLVKAGAAAIFEGPKELFARYPDRLDAA